MALHTSKEFRTMHLFAGCGGGILADMLLGHSPQVAVEIEEYPRKVLLARQYDGILPWFPIWDDVKTFNGKPWCGNIECVSGGFPCQDISQAGKGEGITGEKSGLWKEMARIVREVRPGFVFVENSPLLLRRGIELVLGDLAQMGYNGRWGVFSGADVGAPHKRERIFIFAYSNKDGQCVLYRSFRRVYAGPHIWDSFGTTFKKSKLKDNGAVCGKSDGVPSILDKDSIAALGNAQISQVAALAWKILSGL